MKFRFGDIVWVSNLETTPVLATIIVVAGEFSDFPYEKNCLIQFHEPNSIGWNFTGNYYAYGRDHNYARNRLIALHGEQKEYKNLYFIRSSRLSKC